MKLNKQPSNPNKVYEVKDGGVEGLDYIRASELDEGLLGRLDDQGLIPLDDIDFSSFGYEPTIQGNLELIANIPEYYKITNFSSFRDYSVRFSAGEASLNGDIITLVAVRSGDHVLTVNGFNYKLFVKKGYIERPSIIKVFHSEQGNFLDINTQVTPFKTVPPGETQLSLEVQVFGDQQCELLMNSYEHLNSTANETLVRVGRNFSTLYIRARYKGVEFGSSDWSDVVTHALPLTIVGSSVGAQLGYTADISNEGNRFIVGAPNPNGELGVGGSVSIYKKSTVEGSRYVHGPETVQLTIPQGGSIQIVLDSQEPFNRTFTSSQFVTLPAWASGKAIGKGAIGTVETIPAVEAVPGKGNSLYPSGLPPYEAPEGPIYVEKSRQVLVPATYKEQKVLETTVTPINKGLCCYLTESEAQLAGEAEAVDFTEGTTELINVTFTPKPPPENSEFLRYEKVVSKTISVIKQQEGQYSVGVLVLEQFYTVYKVVDVESHYQIEYYQEVVGYEKPEVGVSFYPDGLPPYEAPVIGFPESYKNIRGPNSYIKIADTVVTFEGGLGNVTAEEKQVYLFTKTQSGGNIDPISTTETLVKLTIPSGGSIRIVTEASEGVTEYDNVFTSSEDVVLPVWTGALTFIGKGGPGRKVWVPAKPAVPQVGLPEYPNGLPVFVPAKYAYEGTLQTSDGFSFNVSWEAELGNSNPSYSNSYSQSYLGFGQVSASIASYPTGTGNFSTTVNIRYFDTTTNSFKDVTLPITGLVNGTVTRPEQGSSEYPSGLPVYKPAEPQIPGYFQDAIGDSSTVLVNKKTLIFEGGTGDTPAVEKTLAIFSSTSVATNNYVLEKTFSYINQPTTVKLNIPAGGSIQLKTNPTAGYTGFDETYTTSQDVVVPGWENNLTVIGKGGPGTKIWVPPIPGTPQQGLPEYPDGLPSYSSYEDRKYVEVCCSWEWRNFVSYNTNAPGFNLSELTTSEFYFRDQERYADTYERLSGFYIVKDHFNTFINFKNSGSYKKYILKSVSYASVNIKGPYTYYGRNSPIGSISTDRIYLSLLSVIINVATGKEYYLNIDGQLPDIICPVYYSKVTVGNPNHPNGLPPYKPGIPTIPGYYTKVNGPVSTVTVGEVTRSFKGGSGDDPAVLSTVEITIGQKDGFGHAVAISHKDNSQIIVAGAPYDTYNNVNKAGGCFYSKLENNEWSALKHLTINTPVENGNFGEKVDISADGVYIFVSSPGTNKVFVYKNFVLESTISPASMTSKTRFGTQLSCSKDGNTVAVGYATGNSISLFKRTGATTWSETVINPAVNTFSVQGKAAENGFIIIEQLDKDSKLIKKLEYRGTSFNTNDWGLDINARKIRISGNGGYSVTPGILQTLNSPEQRLYPMGTWGDFGLTDEFYSYETVPYLGETIYGGSEVVYFGKQFKFTYDATGVGKTYEFDVNSNSDGFGGSLSLSGDGKKLAVGVTSSTNTTGHARVIDLTNNSVLFINPLATVENNYFGKSVSINENGSKLVISEPGRLNNKGGYDIVNLDSTMVVESRVSKNSSSVQNSGSYGYSLSLALRGGLNIVGDPNSFNGLGQLHINAD